MRSYRYRRYSEDYRAQRKRYKAEKERMRAELEREKREYEQKIADLMDRANDPDIDAAERAARQQEYRDFVNTELEKLGLDSENDDWSDWFVKHAGFKAMTLLVAWAHEPGLDASEVEARENKVVKILSAILDSTSSSCHLTDEQKAHEEE